MGLRQQDRLGRRAKREGQAQKAERSGKVNRRAFEVQARRNEISVNRLGVVPNDEVAEIAMRVSSLNQEGNRGGTLIVYPDPPMMSDETRLFRAIRSDVTLRSFSQWDGSQSP